MYVLLIKCNKQLLLLYECTFIETFDTLYFTIKVNNAENEGKMGCRTEIFMHIQGWKDTTQIIRGYKEFMLIIKR